MPEAHRIQFVSRTQRRSPHRRISHVGGLIHHGQPWKLTQPQAIEGIESHRWQFWVSVDGGGVWVIVAIGEYGRKYLKTENDDEQPDGLLSLPECP